MIVPSNIHLTDKCVIYPTHHCFDDAVDLLLMNQAFGRPMGDLYAIHLIVNLKPITGPACLDAHCVVFQPEKNICWQAGFLKNKKFYFGLQQEEFEHLYCVQKQILYDEKSLIYFIEISGYCGPWDAEILACCTDIRSAANNQ